MGILSVFCIWLMLISSKITDNTTNSGRFFIRWGIQSITRLLVRTKDRAEARLQEWICKGIGTGCHLLRCFLLLCPSALVWRLSR